MKKIFPVLCAVMLSVALCVPASAASVSRVAPNPNASIDDCQYFNKIWDTGEIDFSVLKGFYDSEDHYVCCSDCGAFAPFSSLGAGKHPHVEPDCDFCTMYAADGVEFLGWLPAFNDGIIPSISPLVTNAIDWVSLVANCIVNEPLLLMFVCVSFVGIGIGFIKRIIHL